MHSVLIGRMPVCKQADAANGPVQDIFIAALPIRDGRANTASPAAAAAAATASTVGERWWRYNEILAEYKLY